MVVEETRRDLTRASNVQVQVRPRESGSWDSESFEVHRCLLPTDTLLRVQVAVSCPSTFFSHNY